MSEPSTHVVIDARRRQPHVAMLVAAASITTGFPPNLTDMS